MKKTSLLLLFTLSPLPALAYCPSYDTGCINRENSYRYGQQATQQRQEWQQQMQSYQQQNQLRHLQDSFSHQYGNPVGRPYRAF